jgi:NADH-quinone oxidoreductase subunit A
VANRYGADSFKLTIRYYELRAISTYFDVYSGGYRCRYRPSGIGLHPWAAKDSPYECGFEAFEDARMKFDVRYYLVAILFILFDLEIAFLFPWGAALKDVGIVGFWSVMVFLGILVVGFIYEWKKGALDWE